MKTKKYCLVLAVVTAILCVPALGGTGMPQPVERGLIGQSNAALVGIKWLRFSIVTPKTEAQEAKKDGLIWKELLTKVESRLKEAGIEIGHPFYDRLEPMPLGLRVKIDMLKLKDLQQYVFHIQTSFSKPVHLTKDSTWVVPADVWKTKPKMQVISIKDIPATVTDVVLEQVEAFIAACLAANPPDKHPVDVNNIAVALPIVPDKQTTPLVKPTTATYKFVASKNSKVFHKPDCRWAKRIKPGNLVTYSTRNKAIEAGKRPCKFCKP